METPPHGTTEASAADARGSLAFGYGNVRIVVIPRSVAVTAMSVAAVDTAIALTAVAAVSLAAIAAAVASAGPAEAAVR